MTDGSTPLSEANLNKYLASKLNTKCYHAAIIHSAGNLVIDSGTDSNGIVTGDLSYDGTNHWLDITVAGFSNPPVVLITPQLADANYTCKASAVSATHIHVAFYAVADGSRIAAASPDTHMNFNIFIIGF